MLVGLTGHRSSIHSPFNLILNSSFSIQQMSVDNDIRTISESVFDPFITDDHCRIAFAATFCAPKVVVVFSYLPLSNPQIEHGFCGFCRHPEMGSDVVQGCDLTNG